MKKRSKRSKRKKPPAPRIIMVEKDGLAQLSLHGEGKSAIFLAVHPGGIPMIELVNTDGSRMIKLAIGFDRRACIEIYDERGLRCGMALTGDGVVKHLTS